MSETDDYREWAKSNPDARPSEAPPQSVEPRKADDPAPDANDADEPGPSKTTTGAV